MAVFTATIPDFNLNSTWRVVYDALSGKNRYVTGYTPTTDSATKTVSFTGIPAESTIHSAILTATLGSPLTGAEIRSVNDFYFNGSLEVGAVAGGSKSYTFKFKAYGDTATVGNRSSSQTFTNIKITVTYTPPYTAPSVSNVTLAGGTGNLYAGASTGSHVLSWAGTNGSYNAISKYLVYHSVNGGTYALLSDQTATSLNVTAPATAGEHHRYYIVAVGEYSNSSATYSPYLYAYKAPGAPTGLTFTPASVVQGQKSTLSWTVGAAGVGVSVSKYEVYLGATLIGSATGTSLEITAPGTVGTHSYTVKAIGSVSGYNSANSTAKSLTTTAAPAPVIGAVSLAASYVAASANATLSWTATANATNPIAHYAVYRSIAGAAYAHLGNTTGTSMSVTGPGTAGSNHRYYVVAVGIYSNSSAAYSGYLYAYKAPGAPTGVMLSPTSVFTGATTRVSWVAGAAGTGVSTSKYEVYRAGTLVGSTTGLYLDVTAPATAGSYAYTVRAIGSISGYNSDLSAGASLSVENPASTGSLDRSSVAMDGASTIKITIASANSAFTHKAIWKTGSASVVQNVSAGVASTTLTVPLAWCAQHPNATSGTASVVLETYNGAAKTGERTYTFTVSVPASVVPTFSALTASIIANGIAITNRYVQGHSSVALAITGAAGAQGSTISKYAITGGGFTAATTQSATFGKLNTAGTITFTGTITDSRGRTASKSVSITVQAYSAPSLSGVLAYRCNASGTMAANGLYVLLRASNVFSSVDGQNTATLEGRVYMVGATPGAWQGMSSNANLITGAGGILIIKSYTAQIRITDKINNYVYTATIPTDIPLLHGLDNVQGAAIGKYAETLKALEIPGDWSFRRGAYVGLDSGNYVDAIYPVGAIYMSNVSTSPSTLFGGTWSAISNPPAGASYWWERTA